MRKRNAVIAAIAAFGLLAIAPSAFADSGNGRHDPIIGNVTGNYQADRTTLGSDSTGCTATVERGLGHGHYAAPVVHHYTIAGLSSPALCPDMGTTVERRWTAVDDLVVTWFNQPPGVSSVYVLRNFHVLSGSDGEQFPSFVGSQDFNGDGRGDVWTTSDQDEQFSTLLRSGSGFVTGPASFYTVQANPSLAFGRLDNRAGTDIAAGYISPRRDQAGLPAGSAGSGALVVFGQSGNKVLLEQDPTGQTVYTVKILDANCDGRNDVKVSDGTGAAPRIYLGDGRGHFHLAHSTAH